MFAGHKGLIVGFVVRWLKYLELQSDMASKAAVLVLFMGPCDCSRCFLLFFFLFLFLLCFSLFIHGVTKTEIIF